MTHLVIRGNCPMGCGRTLERGVAGHVRCSAPDCPRPNAAGELLLEMGGAALVTPSAHAELSALAADLDRKADHVAGTVAEPTFRHAAHMARERAAGPAEPPAVPEVLSSLAAHWELQAFALQHAEGDVAKAMWLVFRACAELARRSALEPSDAAGEPRQDRTRIEGGEPENDALSAADAEAGFLAASVAVWREIDCLDSEPGGYHPVRMSIKLRQEERAAWERYRPFADLIRDQA